MRHLLEEGAPAALACLFNAPPRSLILVRLRTATEQSARLPALSPEPLREGLLPHMVQLTCFSLQVSNQVLGVLSEGPSLPQPRTRVMELHFLEKTCKRPQIYSWGSSHLR